MALLPPQRVVIIPSNENEEICNNDYDDYDNEDENKWLCHLLNVPSFDEYVKSTLLLRPSSSSSTDTIPGLYAYHVLQDDESDNINNNNNQQLQQKLKPPNVRATRLAMSCGLLSVRFYGDVVVVLQQLRQQPHTAARTTYCSLLLSVDDVRIASCTSPDLRYCIVNQLLLSKDGDNNDTTTTTKIIIPEWLANASMNNYHDGEVLAQLAKVMMTMTGSSDDDSDSDGESSSSSDSSKNGDKATATTTVVSTKNVAKQQEEQQQQQQQQQQRKFVATTTVPLCLHCRRPATKLCPECHGAYFCCCSDSDDNDNDDDNNGSRRTRRRDCKKQGWSHECFCPVWKLYVDRREELSTFVGLGDWCSELVGRDCQLSNQPYERLLADRFGIYPPPSSTQQQPSPSISSSWWRTEFGGGWSGGDSDSAKTIDVTQRQSYAQGFYPLTGEDIPPERRVTDEDITRADSSIGRHNNNQLDMIRLECWEDYYRLRDIPTTSPVALLMTFPLTLYYAIAEYGEVPCTVSKMLKRSLRVHIVGAEKELGFLDLFKEVLYLLPPDFSLELVFAVRNDMLPPKLRNETTGQYRVDDPPIHDNLQVRVVAGTYGDSLDPNFDCGSGPPDMVLAFNAGLYAYESWRSVVRYLDHNRGVVGVFSDYNEMSGAQCASLGGAVSRESVRINPFRQPRAMPVYCMNLPQFCNGFLYVFNQQTIE